MYYPYFRGKQYELITIRENAELLRQSGFVPIIEPVKEALGGLTKSLSAIEEAEGDAVVIVNPYHGDHSHNAENVRSLFKNELKQNFNISPGILLTEEVSVDDAITLCNGFEDRAATLIHSGFTEAKLLSQRLGDKNAELRHVFLEDSCGKLYQKHFKDAQRILLRDGFQK